MTLHPIPLNFLIYKENFLFYQCGFSEIIYSRREGEKDFNIGKARNDYVQGTKVVRKKK
jgi:hypothetical protein